MLLRKPQGQSAMLADVENAYAGLEKKGKGKKGKGVAAASKAAEGSQQEDKKLMHSLDMLGAFATLKVHSPTLLLQFWLGALNFCLPSGRNVVLLYCVCHFCSIMGQLMG